MPSVSNVDSYFKIVKEKYQGRRLIDAARSILNETASGEDADLLLESAEQKIYDIRSGRDKSGVKTIRESILEVIDTMQKLSGADRDKFAGIPTGFNYLDTVLTGLGRSDLIILAARPGMGKTSFALNIATNVARQQKVPTIIFSLDPHDQPGSQEGKNRARYHRLPAADAECQAHREPRAGDQ